MPQGPAVNLYTRDCVICLGKPRHVRFQCTAALTSAPSSVVGILVQQTVPKRANRCEICCLPDCLFRLFSSLEPARTTRDSGEGAAHSKGPAAAVSVMSLGAFRLIPLIASLWKPAAVRDVDGSTGPSDLGQTSGEGRGVPGPRSSRFRGALWVSSSSAHADRSAGECVQLSNWDKEPNVHFVWPTSR